MEAIGKCKKALYEKCLDYVEQRILNVRSSMDAPRSAANDESKAFSGTSIKNIRAYIQK